MSGNILAIIALAVLGALLVPIVMGFLAIMGWFPPFSIKLFGGEIRFGKPSP